MATTTPPAHHLIPLPSPLPAAHSTADIVVGGANRWTYDSFVNWEFFPEVREGQGQGQC